MSQNCAGRCWSCSRPWTIPSASTTRPFFVAAKHPKSFVSLDGTDHLLTRRDDAIYVADVIAAWARAISSRRSRHIDDGRTARRVVVQETRAGKFQQTVTVGPHRCVADEPLAAGGNEAAPAPTIVAGALGACTAMTMRLYADRKALPLDRVTVTLRHRKIHARTARSAKPRGLLDRIDREIAIEGALDAEQRKRLMEIADKCPVHRTLTSEIRIVTRRGLDAASSTVKRWGPPRGERREVRYRPTICHVRTAAPISLLRLRRSLSSRPLSRGPLHRRDGQRPHFHAALDQPLRDVPVRSAVPESCNQLHAARRDSARWLRPNAVSSAAAR